jgi:DNA-binding NarL/FixJ family response regulator
MNEFDICNKIIVTVFCIGMHTKSIITMESIKSFLLLVEDDLNFAEWAVTELRRDCADLTVVCCHDLSQARAWLASPQAPLLAMAVVDLHLGQELGVDLIGQLHQSHAQIPLLVLTSVDATQEALRAIRAGAQGYVLKNTVEKELSRAVAQLRAGGSPINPGIAFQLLAEFRAADVVTDAVPGSGLQEAMSALPTKLSQRETEVLKLVARGYADKEVAARLGIAPSTVDSHIRAIFRKFSVHSRAQLRRVLGE